MPSLSSSAVCSLARWWHTVSEPDLGSTVVVVGKLVIVPDSASAASAVPLSSLLLVGEKASLSASDTASPPLPELVFDFPLASPPCESHLVTSVAIWSQLATEREAPSSAVASAASCYKVLPPWPLLLVAEWMSGTVNSLSSSLRLLSSSELMRLTCLSLDSSAATPPPPTDDVETME